MSECVVRMKMPKNCWVCPFGLDGYIWNENDARTLYVRFCSRHSGEEFHVSEIKTIDRPWYCDSFVCQLPEGHGRLVDAEAAFAEIVKRSIKGYISNTGVYAALQEAPTIVPAEAERSEK